MAEPRKKLPLHTNNLIGLVLGAIAGGTLNSILGAKEPNLAFVTQHITEPIGTLFIRLLLLLVVPLVFSSPSSASRVSAT
jgi:DAACS family dicarboxylate/amino acid:cation (Na+ or H+) symporter